MEKSLPYPSLWFTTAKETSDFWQEFQAGKHWLVLTRYRTGSSGKCDRYSLFIFLKNSKTPDRCFNYESDKFLYHDPKMWKAYYGENHGHTHSTIEEAPLDLTIEQFKLKAIQWASNQLRINIDKIIQQETKMR